MSAASRTRIRDLELAGKSVKVMCVGRKGATFLKREMGSRVVDEISFAGKKRVGFEDAQDIANRITAMLDAGEFDVCTLVYNRFRSVITHVPTGQQLIPTQLPEAGPAEAAAGPQALYEYEPGEEQILASLLPQNLAIQVYRALLENAAGFFGSQMNAMDNATRNAGEMINKLTLNYNRTRQANITKELIEIISGAEAV